jgi:hypothetical protein
VVSTVAEFDLILYGPIGNEFDRKTQALRSLKKVRLALAAVLSVDAGRISLLLGTKIGATKKTRINVKVAVRSVAQKLDMEHSVTIAQFSSSVASYLLAQGVGSMQKSRIVVAIPRPKIAVRKTSGKQCPDCMQAT